MAILDIREEQEEEITGIKFDDSDDLVVFNDSTIFFMSGGEYGEEIALCDLRDSVNFIAALHKAKELAGR